MNIPEVIQQAFRKKKSARPAFTLKKFAAELGVSPSYISQVLHGKRRIALSKVEKLCKLLDLDAEKRDQILRELIGARGKSIRPGIAANLGTATPEAEESKWDYLPTKLFWILDQWFYAPILDCTLLKDFDGSPEFIARRLRLPKPLVDKAIAELLAAGLLERPEGLLRKGTALFDVHSSSSKESIRNFHLETLRLAGEELRVRTGDQDLDLRLITSGCLTVAEEDIPWAKQKLKSCLEEIYEKCSKAEGAEVYQIGALFFPLTKPVEAESEG